MTPDVTSCNKFARFSLKERSKIVTFVQGLFNQQFKYHFVPVFFANLEVERIPRVCVCVIRKFFKLFGSINLERHFPN